MNTTSTSTSTAKTPTQGTFLPSAKPALLALSSVEGLDYKGKTVRIVTDRDGTRWMVGVDACSALGFTSSHHLHARGLPRAKLRREGLPACVLDLKALQDLSALRPGAAAFLNWAKAEVWPATLPQSSELARLREEHRKTREALEILTHRIEAAEARQKADEAEKRAAALERAAQVRPLLLGPTES